MGDYLEGLIGELSSRDGMTRKKARECLVLVGEPAAPLVRALIHSPDKQTRWEAIKTLAAIGDPASLDEFVALLDSPDPDLRWLAATGLIQLGPRSVRPVLQAVTDPEVTRGRLEMSRRVLGGLASDNKVLADLLAPLMQVIGGTDGAVVAERAARSLSDLDQAAGRPPAQL